MSTASITRPNDIYTDGTYLANNPDWDSADGPWKAEQIAQVLTQHKLNPSTICEVGCGSGIVLQYLHRHFPEAICTGYDISPQAQTFWEDKQSETMHFVVGDIAKSNLLRQDVMVVADVIEHVEDYFSFLQSLRGRAKHYVLHIPLELSVLSMLRPQTLLHSRKQVGHIHQFVPQTARAVLQDCGFTIVGEQFTCGSLDLPAPALRTKLATWPRKIFMRYNPDLGARIIGGFSLLILVKDA